MSNLLLELSREIRNKTDLIDWLRQFEQRCLRLKKANKIDARHTLLDHLVMDCYGEVKQGDILVFQSLLRNMSCLKKGKAYKQILFFTEVLSTAFIKQCQQKYFEELERLVDESIHCLERRINYLSEHRVEPCLEKQLLQNILGEASYLGYCSLQHTDTLYAVKIELQLQRSEAKLNNEVLVSSFTRKKLVKFSQMLKQAQAKTREFSLFERIRNFIYQILWRIKSSIWDLKLETLPSTTHTFFTLKEVSYRAKEIKKNIKQSSFVSSSSAEVTLLL